MQNVYLKSVQKINWKELFPLHRVKKCKVIALSNNKEFLPKGTLYGNSVIFIPTTIKKICKYPMDTCFNEGVNEMVKIIEKEVDTFTIKFTYYDAKKEFAIKYYKLQIKE